MAKATNLGKHLKYEYLISEPVNCLNSIECSNCVKRHSFIP